jgi:hypothetical protein
MVAPGRPFVHLFIPSRRLWQGKLLILSYSISLLMFDVREIT